MNSLTDRILGGKNESENFAFVSMCVHLCSADQKVIQKERYKQTDTEFRDRQKGMGFSISAPQREKEFECVSIM